MFTGYWIFIFVSCFILGKLEECIARNVRKNILKLTRKTLKNFTTITELISLQVQVSLKWGSLTRLFVKKGNHFPEKQKFDSKTQDMFDNFQQKCFFKNFP